MGPRRPGKQTFPHSRGTGTPPGPQPQQRRHLHERGTACRFLVGFSSGENEVTVGVQSRLRQDREVQRKGFRGEHDASFGPPPEACWGQPGGRKLCPSRAAPGLGEIPP